MFSVPNSNLTFGNPGSSQNKPSMFGIPPSTSTNMYNPMNMPATGATAGFQDPLMSFPAGADTLYKSLPPHIQAEFVDIYKNYKEPVRQVLRKLASVEDRKIEAVFQSLQQSHLATTQLSRKYEKLCEHINSLHQQVKETTSNSLQICTSGIQDVKKRGSVVGVTSEGINLLLKLLHGLEQKLSDCSLQINQLECKYTSTYELKEGRFRGLYGQRIAIGPQQMLQLVLQQNESLLQVAANLADIHRETEELRRKFLLVTAPDQKGNPFIYQQLKDADEDRRLVQKLRADVQESIRNLPATVGGYNASQQPAATGSSFPSFSLPSGPTDSTFGAKNQFSAQPTANPLSFSLNPSIPQTNAATGGTLNALDLAKPVTGFGTSSQLPMTSPNFRKNAKSKKN